MRTYPEDIVSKPSTKNGYAGYDINGVQGVDLQRYNILYALRDTFKCGKENYVQGEKPTSSFHPSRWKP